MSVTASSDAVPATEVLAEARAVGASQRGRLRTPVDIEVVIPAYNESARLPETLRQSVAYLDRQPWSSRLVVVDNGSVDETAADARIAAAGTDKVGVTVSSTTNGRMSRRADGLELCDLCRNKYPL